ncbi:MAG: cytochrome-c peroxidase [Methylobacter sp.]
MRFILHLLVLNLGVGLLFSSASLADRNLGLPPLTIPGNNPQTAEKIALGHVLFNDKRLSADNSISCASCHQPDKAFTDGLPVSTGINGQTGTRNAPTVVNSAYYQILFLDGRRNNLEEQALDPLTNPVEHGLENHQKIITIIQQDIHYLQQFKKVFKNQANPVTMDNISKAIASFERSLIAGNLPFDRYYFGGDQSALSPSAARGSRIFRRKGNCANCHEISFNNALLSNNRFYNIGIGFKKLEPVLDAFIAAVTSGENPDSVPLTDSQRSELGRFNITKVPADIGRFKNPTLRNVALTAPYMHDGSIKTLAEVIDYYDKGGDKTPFLDPSIFALYLTSQEKADLLAFLQSLTSPQDTKL